MLKTVHINETGQENLVNESGEIFRNICHLFLFHWINRNSK